MPVLGITPEEAATTGIQTVKAVERKTVDDDAWYNLQGQKVRNPQHGIFIHGGKKYVK